MKYLHLLTTKRCNTGAILMNKLFSYCFLHNLFYLRIQQSKYLGSLFFITVQLHISVFKQYKRIKLYSVTSFFTFLISFSFKALWSVRNSENRIMLHGFERE